MPVYAVRCQACGHQEEQFHSMSQDHLPCSKCSGVVDVDFTRQNIQRERHFCGSERDSVMYGFHPDEVQEARREFASTGADISDYGTVSFDKRSTQVAFQKKWNEIKRAGDKRIKETLASKPES